MDNGRKAFQAVQWCADSYSAVIGADAAVILTEWNVFRGLDLRRLARDMRQPVLVDFRNLFPLADARAAGIAYHSVGRQSIAATARQDAAIIPFRSGAA